jgi:hypothetical protein
MLDNDSKNQSYIKRSLITLAMICVITIFACSQDFGRLRSSPEVTLKFKQYQVDESLNYYFFGWQGDPTAIIGLHKDITLESDQWQPIDFNEISLQTLVDRVGGRSSTNRSGAIIVDPQGNQIGVWFAGGGTATIKMAGEKRVAYISPTVRVKERGILTD